MSGAIAETTLEARTRGLAGLRLALLRGGAEVAEIRSSSWRARADLTIGETRFLLARESMFGRFVLLAGEEVLASATKRSAFRNDFELALGRVRFRLRRRGILARRFLLEHDGIEVGEIRREGIFRTGVSARLPGDWPLPLQAFVVWLAWDVWRRETAAAAGG